MGRAEDVAQTLYPSRDVRRGARGKAKVSTPVEAPEARRDGDEFTFFWPRTGIAVGLTNLRETPGGLYGEIAVESSTDGRLHWSRASLASAAGRETVVRALDQAHPGVNWRHVLEHVCQATAEQFRAGEPVVSLRAAAVTRDRFLVEPILPLGETAVAAGDGGAGKGFVAMTLALAVATSVPLPDGLRATERTSVLLLDWESCVEEHEARLGALARGFGLSEFEGIYYRRMTRSLADEAARIRAEVSRLRIGLVIVDSFGPACGAEPETADAATRLFNALRSLAPATRLVITHVSKATAEQRSGAARPYGSVYVWNLARSVWEVRRGEEDEDEDLLAVALFHRKVNRGRLRPPIGLRFEFAADGAIRVRAQDIAERSDLLVRASIPYRIHKALASGARTTAEVAELIDADEETVARTLRRLRRAQRVVRIDEAREGKAARWGLPARQ